MYPAIDAIRRTARAVLESGTDEPLQAFGLSPGDLFALVGMERWTELERELR
ncbi:MAG TPA: hypothetical protein VHX88_05255 [Solirubrobacteraceae bacterium]|jgi:hypothetical protein|nr:hypothetical protein [Solirubrobacteraceae bacterium]